MKLFGAEQERVLVSFYGAEAAEVYGALLRSLSVVLEEKVSPLSLALDQGKGEIAKLRRVIFEQGLCKLPHASEFGGMGVPFGVYALAMELAGAADASTAMSLGIHDTVAEAVAKFGSPEQKKRLLPALLSGKKLAAFALTEPSSGSDARSMHTDGREGRQVLSHRRFEDVHHQRGRGRRVSGLRRHRQRARRVPRRGLQPRPEGREGAEGEARDARLAHRRGQARKVPGPGGLAPGGGGKGLRSREGAPRLEPHRDGDDLRRHRAGRLRQGARTTRRAGSCSGRSSPTCSSPGRRSRTRPSR